MPGRGRALAAPGAASPRMEGCGDTGTGANGWAAVQKLSRKHLTFRVIAPEFGAGPN